MHIAKHPSKIDFKEKNRRWHMQCKLSLNFGLRNIQEIRNKQQEVIQVIIKMNTEWCKKSFTVFEGWNRSQDEQLLYIFQNICTMTVLLLEAEIR